MSNTLPGYGAAYPDPHADLAAREALRERYSHGEDACIGAVMIGTGDPLTPEMARSMPGAVAGIAVMSGNTATDQASIDRINASFGNDTPPTGYSKIHISTPDPLHPWACSTCGATVERTMLTVHTAWHAKHP